MVTDQRSQEPDKMIGLLEAIRAGLESLTVTGPSMILNSLYREALEAVTRRPTQQERETALSQAWLASNEALRLLGTGNSPAGMRAVDEMYQQVRMAISASRPSLR
jgi:hypothetical protein